MVDRLEELLALLEEENEDGQEDVPALKNRKAAAPAPEEDGGEPAPSTGSGGRDRRDALAERAAEPPEWTAEPLDWGIGGAAEAGGPGDAEGPERGGSDMAEELAGGPVWRRNSRAAQEAEAVWRQELSERPEGMDGAAEMLRPAVERAAQAAGESLRAGQERAGGLTQAAGRGAESGLESLYRRTVQASRPMPQVSVEQAGRTLRAEEPERTAALTVDELDRAVRRDSRRYDGGMMIF